MGIDDFDEYWWHTTIIYNDATSMIYVKIRVGMAIELINELSNAQSTRYYNGYQTKHYSRGFHATE